MTAEQVHGESKRCGSGRRDVEAVTNVLTSALEAIKEKRGVPVVDVDVISNALYSSWCTP